MKTADGFDPDASGRIERLSALHLRLAPTKAKPQRLTAPDCKETAAAMPLHPVNARL